MGRDYNKVHCDDHAFENNVAGATDQCSLSSLCDTIATGRHTCWYTSVRLAYKYEFFSLLRWAKSGSVWSNNTSVLASHLIPGASPEHMQASHYDLFTPEDHIGLGSC